MDPSDNRPVLELRNINLRLGNQSILHNINFNLNKGEIHALVGEHKAGKTSLVKIISGELAPDQGQIVLNGVSSPRMFVRKAFLSKIGVVHQESGVIPTLTAMENIIAGSINVSFLTHNYRVRMNNLCREILSDHLGIDIPLDLPAGRLSPREQQMVEIARIIYLDPDIIIIDDIGSRMTPREMRVLLRYLKHSRDNGKSIIFIDSGIDNVLEAADRVTTLHHGFLGGTEPTRSLDRLKLLKLTYNFALNLEPYRDEESLMIFTNSYNEQVLSDLPAGVIVLDSDNRLSLMNRTAEQILDIDSRENLNKPLDLILKDNPDKLNNDVLAAVRQKEIRSWDALTLGSSLSIKVRTSPFFDAEQVFKGTIILIEDVTIDSSIKDYLARAEKISSIAELAAGVSHEINNPLGIINNYIQILKIRNLDNDTKEKLQKMEVQLKRITDITGSLLSFSRLRENPLSNFDLIQLLNEIILLLDYKLKQKSVSLKKKNFTDSLIIKGDENRLRQVFVNIINNSVEAVTDRGKIEISLNLSRERDDKDYIRVSIRDNGYGIPPEIQKKIFDPFFSTKIARNNAGLGLSICQHIVELHNGLISFESVPGEFTVFHIHLPVE